MHTTRPPVALDLGWSDSVSTPVVLFYSPEEFTICLTRRSRNCSLFNIPVPGTRRPQNIVRLRSLEVGSSTSGGIEVLLLDRSKARETVPDADPRRLGLITGTCTALSLGTRRSYTPLERFLRLRLASPTIFNPCTC